MLKKIFVLLAFCNLAYAGENEAIVQFLYDMLENWKFHDYDFLEEHCSESMLKMLQEDYVYICDEGPCYAVWDFRGESQDVGEWKILNITSDGDGWFTYTYKEDGIVGKHSIHAHMLRNKVILFDFR